MVLHSDEALEAGLRPSCVGTPVRERGFRDEPVATPVITPSGDLRSPVRLGVGAEAILAV